MQANTLAAFNNINELAGDDDLLRMVLLAIKLFSDDSISDELRPVIEAPRRSYLVFMWSYVRCRVGPRRKRAATELFSRLHLSFVDLRSLEIRMTEFAKLVSLEGLSPLMQEICSFRANGNVGGGGSGDGSGEGTPNNAANNTNNVKPPVAM